MLTTKTDQWRLRRRRWEGSALNRRCLGTEATGPIGSTGAWPNSRLYTWLIIRCLAGSGWYADVELNREPIDLSTQALSKREWRRSLMKICFNTVTYSRRIDCAALQSSTRKDIRDVFPLAHQEISNNTNHRRITSPLRKKSHAKVDWLFGRWL